MEDKKPESATTKITRFYVEQAERSAPKLKNAVDDWQRLCSGLLDASFNAQKSVMRTIGVENKLVDQLEDMMKSTTKTSLKMQKEFADATIDASLNIAKSLLEKTEKA